MVPPELTSASQDPESLVECPNEPANVEQLRAQRAADREARRQQHLMATSGGSGMEAAHAAAAEPDPERFARAGYAPGDDLVVKATREYYPDVEAEFLKEDIRRNAEQIRGWEARATGVVDMLAEAQRKIDEAMSMAELDDE